MKIVEGDQQQRNSTRPSKPPKLPTVDNQEELKGLKEKVDLLIKEVKKIMERMKSHEQDG